jgi:predicted nuclease of predicted toxin-antitoxin system
VAAGLRRLGIDVTTTPEAGLLGATDTEQLAYALAQGRVIFSQDDDFLVLASQGAEHAGLAYCRQQSRSIGEIIQALELIWEVYEPDEMRNRVEFI